MTWGNGFPLVDLAQRLIETRLRAERVSLAQRAQRVGEHGSVHGLPPAAFDGLRVALQAEAPRKADAVDPLITSPSRHAGIFRRRYLTVKSRPGSIF